MLTSTITQKGQVTLPKKVRDVLSVGPNDRIIFVRRGNEYVIKPVKDFTKMRGALTVREPQDLQAVRQQVIKNIAEHAAGE